MNIIEKINIKLILLTIYIYIYISLGGVFATMIFSDFRIDELVTAFFYSFIPFFIYIWSKHFVISLISVIISFSLVKFNMIKKIKKIYIILFHILILPLSFFGYFILFV